MARRFLIDGYNLLYAVGLPARLAPGELRHSRDRLLTLIHERHPHDAITVVFDAHTAPRHLPREQIVHGMHVVFAVGEADDRIKTMLDHDSVARTLIVVSSDRAVQQSAKRRDAQVMSAEAFLDDLDRAAPVPAPIPPEKPTSESDVKHWMETFASIDESPEVQRLQHIEPMNPDPGRVKKHRRRPKKKEDQ